MFTIALSTDAASDPIEASTDQDLHLTSHLPSHLPSHLVTGTKSSEH